MEDLEGIYLTDEQKDKILIVRIGYGDVKGSMFYPILTDYEVYLILEQESWNVRKAILRCAYSAAFQLSMLNTREKTGDIDITNLAALEYRKVLDALVRQPTFLNLPEKIIPYVAGMSKEDKRETLANPDFNRNPLFQITPCTAWWTKLENKI
mgnify:FL=1